MKFKFSCSKLVSKDKVNLLKLKMRHRAKIKCQMPKAIDNDKSAIHFSKTKCLKKKMLM